MLIMAIENATSAVYKSKSVTIKVANAVIHGDLVVPENATGIVLFAHGSGSSRFSTRNRYVASVLQESGLATLLFDLLSSEEEAVDELTRALRFDIDLLTRRLVLATDWVINNDQVGKLNLGYFGSSTGAAAAIKAAVVRSNAVAAVVSRGGRPDLAGSDLSELQAPTLLIVGGWDHQVIELNEEAFKKMKCEKKLEIVAGATHLFEERGKLEVVAQLASSWFTRFLA
jgi:dienelactone hydrolase